MAAFNLQRSGSRLSYNGGSIGEEQLPTGSCGFRDLSIGVRAPTCSCRKFWLNTGHFNGQNGSSDRVFCFCGHHACFHNAFGQQQRTAQTSLDAAGTGVMQNGLASMLGAQGGAQVQESQPKPTGLGIRPGSSAQTQSINTRLWDALNAFAREQEDAPRSDVSSKLPSTACPSIVGDLRPSPSRVLHDRASQLRAMAPPVNIPAAYMHIPGADEYSATEVATPSVNGTPDLRAFAAPGSHPRTSPNGVPAIRAPSIHSPAAQVRLTTEAAQPSSSRPNIQHLSPPPANLTMSAQEVTSLLRAFGHRIDVLENLSFSQVPIEEIQDKFENFDGRILDLEQWRTDHERIHGSPEPAKPESSKRRRLSPVKNDSLSSDESFDSAAAAHTEAAVLATLAANAETVPRIEALESRVVELENAALPSFARPWHVQVVLLPWGRDLRGIWFSALEATQHSLRSSQQGDEWTGAQSAPRISFKSSAGGAWTTESIEAWADEAQEWLSPKACGPTGIVFQRLESRGLVQDIAFTAPDSRHILSTLSHAFGKILESPRGDVSEQADRYQGLCESFVPLRKVRKSSRLRFLSPAEMITSSSWDAGLLDSSVFMKVNDGQRRLYITTPNAYFQPRGQAWIWQTIRRLPMFNATGEEQAAQATSAVIEACWTYNDRLDQPISSHASFASHESHWSPHSHQPLHEDANNGGGSNAYVSEARPTRQRTVSLPSSSSAAEQAKASLQKRRVASFETGTSMPTMPLTDEQMTMLATAKRRRISTSPEAERKGMGLTPRWSREPPSPFTSEPAGEAHSQSGVSRRRGTTPFAYATPHSNNNNFVGRMDFTTGDGDTEADTDMVFPQSERGEDEWHGVEEDGDNTEMQGNAPESEVDDAELDEQLPADRLMGYED